MDEWGLLGLVEQRRDYGSLVRSLRAEQKKLSLHAYRPVL